jgi:uncharacterized protein
LFISPHITIATIPNKGNGIIALHDIAADTIIEESPVIVMDAQARPLLDATLLHDYIFIWGQKEDQCCMAQGYISIYNHSYTSNAEYIMDFENNTISIITVKEVMAGEEICINYNGDADNGTPIWFDAQ